MSEFVLGGTIGMVQAIAGHPLDTIKTLLQNNQSTKLRLSQYYRGVMYPTAASVAFNIAAFPCYTWLITEKKMNAYCAGFITGLAVSPIEYGFGVGKIRRQTLTPTPLHAKGFTMAYLRTTGAMTVYFGIYEDLNPTTGPFVAGALGGLANWTLTYPFDIISTRQIANKWTVGQALRAGKLWRGYTPCAVRALLVNGLSFKLYDMFSP